MISKPLLFPLDNILQRCAREWPRVQTEGQTGNICLLETSAVLLCSSYNLPKFTSRTLLAQNTLL